MLTKQKKHKYKTLERGGGWAQSNQKTIEVTLKKVKNINIPNHENLSLALISEHFDGDQPRDGHHFDITIQGKLYEDRKTKSSSSRKENTELRNVS